MTTLQEALIEVSKAVGFVENDARNDYYGYSYSSADAVLSKVRDACAKYGVAVVGSTVEIVAKDGNKRIVKMSLTFAKGEEKTTFEGLGEGEDNNDKGTMKANTAALKYLLANAFLISWGDDPEASTRGGKKTQGAKRSTAKKAPAKKSPLPGLQKAVEALTTETLASVKKDILSASEKLSDEEYDSIVDAYKVKAKQLES